MAPSNIAMPHLNFHNLSAHTDVSTDEHYSVITGVCHDVSSAVLPEMNSSAYLFRLSIAHLNVCMHVFGAVYILKNTLAWYNIPTRKVMTLYDEVY